MNIGRRVYYCRYDVKNEIFDKALLSFLFRRSTTLYNRRQSKILTLLASLFTSCYIFNWQQYFPDTPLLYPPSFDGRIILYPGAQEVRDYFSWRQVDSKHDVNSKIPSSF